MAKFNVFRVEHCLQCGNENQWIVRSWNVNENLTDSDIDFIAANSIGNDRFYDCDECKRLTKHRVVSFNRLPL